MSRNGRRGTSSQSCHARGRQHGKFLRSPGQGTERRIRKKNDWIQRANQQFLTRASEEDKIIDSTADNNYHTSEEKFEDQIRNSVILYIQNKIPQAPDRSNISEIMATWTLPSAVKKDDVPEP